MKQGDIYLVNWSPSVGHEFQKVRPAIVLSGDAILKRSNLIAFVAISSQKAKHFVDDIFIAKDSENNLFEDSVIKMHHISSFDYNRVIKKVGRISEPLLAEIKIKIREHFNL
ncbi:type II toxin-antitoxin system PemK/MazF family toxin [Candidatus Peregrinibacteria bacterium]|nr:type II toxin-antitoxin system PemK/MazF family toxin [Candidatus Peregrinibacteria bacterium]